MKPLTVCYTSIKAPRYSRSAKARSGSLRGTRTARS